MPEEKTNVNPRQVRMRHLGRRGQIGVYFWKLLRMFLYQSDWLVLPMSALIAGLVGMVIAGRYHVYMEGTAMSSLAITCACLWNGCFNSIQVICRERGVIKREHRNGMHISSYIVAHMMYQALLCFAQTVISLYVFRLIKVSFPERGIFFTSFSMEFLISMFLITYAADMMSLWISCLARTTTAAMTIMPVVLIFQLVFSGGMMTLPSEFEPVRNFTISSWGIKLVSAESDYNNQPLATAWNALWGMRDTELNASFTVGQALDFIEESNDKTVRTFREAKIVDDDDLLGTITVDDVVKLLREEELAQELRDRKIDIHVTLSEMMDMVGAEKVRTFVLDTTSAAAFKAEYAFTQENITDYWVMLFLFCVLFAGLATVTLEFIDHDKR